MLPVKRLVWTHCTGTVARIKRFLLRDEEAHGRGLRDVRAPSGTFGDLLAELGFLETNFGFFDF